MAAFAMFLLAVLAEAFTSAILCNGLACLAVWLTYSAGTIIDKVVVIVPPIAAFVAMGFEHSVANISRPLHDVSRR